MTRRAWPRYRRVHFVGIGGVGMSGIADVLLTLGHDVSGSDAAESETTNRLREAGADVFIGHDAGHVETADVVVVSSAIPANNVEVQRARDIGVPVIPRAEMLAELMRLKHGIAIAGSHGKTTTTSMAAWLIAEAGLDPTHVVGGRVGKLGGARLGQGDLLVCEADESDGSFLRLTPSIAVVTNIDDEHLDHYGGSAEALREAFVSFCNAVPFYGAAVVCLDDPGVQEILPAIERRTITYGTSTQADFSLRELHIDGPSTSFTVVHHGDEIARAVVPRPGRHVALNALAALAVALELGIDASVAAAALESFEGVERRMTSHGEHGGVLVYDDYAHHPTEIEATLEALAEAHPDRRLVAVFQPHRYSRVQALFDGFCRSFYRADLVVVTDVYPAGESPIEGVTGEALAEGLRRHGHRAVRRATDLDAATTEVLSVLEAGDVLVTLGAGDVARIGRGAVEALDAGRRA